MSALVKSCVSEFVGTCLFVFFGVMSIVIGHPSLAAGAVSLVSVALAHGLALGIMVTCTMAISGGQLNPAVSLGLVVAGKQSASRAIVMIVVQLIGAACAAGLVLYLVTPDVANTKEAGYLGRTAGVFTDKGLVGVVLIIEMMLTFVLMSAVLMGTVDSRAPRLGGFVIGLTVTACILAAGPLTGASMNPARTFGPAFCGNHWEMHWVYWAGPVAGAFLAAVVYRMFWEEHAKG
jgi:aquaporin Z